MSHYLGNFNQAAYQQRIDRTVSTANGRPLIKLVWCPDEFRWMPHQLTTDPPGYTFPVFCNGRDADGEFRAPDRWGLLQRIEWEQYGPTWEAIRYKRHNGDVWDLKGPCPSEKYVELKCYCYHNGKCCPCIGDTCSCSTYCWGNYVEPDEGLMSWIRETSWQSTHDSDVDPHADVRYFEATHAQQELASKHDTAQQAEKADMEQFDREMREVYLRQANSIVVNGLRDQGLRKTESGLYLID